MADLNAMILGMPTALFPAIALDHFHGGPQTVGYLYAAPGAGALVGMLLSGWTARVVRPGRAVVAAIAVWGVAIAAFGLSPWLWAALVLLAVAGWADVISAVFRSTILQVEAPDRLRGRLSAIQAAVVQGGPRLGNAEAGRPGGAGRRSGLDRVRRPGLCGGHRRRGALHAALRGLPARRRRAAAGERSGPARARPAAERSGPRPARALRRKPARSPRLPSGRPSWRSESRAAWRAGRRRDRASCRAAWARLWSRGCGGARTRSRAGRGVRSRRRSGARWP